MTRASRLLGYPDTQHLTIDSTGQRVSFPGKLVGLHLYNQGAAIVRVYWTGATFGADLASGTNYVPLAANGSPGDIFDRDLTFVADRGLWLRAESGSNLVIVTALVESTQ